MVWYSPGYIWKANHDAITSRHRHHRRPPLGCFLSLSPSPSYPPSGARWASSTYQRYRAGDLLFPSLPLLLGHG